MSSRRPDRLRRRDGPAPPCASVTPWPSPARRCWACSTRQGAAGHQGPADGDTYALIDLKSFGARLVGPYIQFAVNTFGTRAHPNYPAEFDIYVDTNRDGNDDFVIYNYENGGFAATGQNLVAVVNLATGAGGAYFHTDADVNSGNAILTAPLSVLSLTPGTPRYVPNNYAPVVPAGESITLGISAVPGGDTASPSQKGLLMYRDARQTEADAIYVTP